MNFVKEIKKLFGVYDPFYEYWVDRKRIKVNSEWRKTKIGRDKWRRKLNFYLRTGEFESYIVIRHKDWMLVDGYSSLRIAEVLGIDKVPVHFI